MARNKWARLGQCLAGLVLMLGLQACQTDLYKNLSERQANAIVATLAQQGIQSSRRFQDDGDVTVMLEEADFPEAVGILNDAGLPQEDFSDMGEIFKGNGLVSSPAQERARMIFALGQELSHTITDIDGVLTARVQVVLADNDLLQADKKPSSASVFVRHNGRYNADEMTPRVKQLVANGVSGLTYANVSVVTVKALEPPASDQSQRAFSSFLGIAMPESSVGPARWMFTSMFVVIIALAAGLCWLLWRQRGRQVYTLSSPSS